MRVDFYHLAAIPLERVLPSICERLLDAGERLLIVAGEAQLAQLDRDLWMLAADSFLPHGTSAAPLAEHQPILLSGTAEPANGARNVAIADGVWRNEALAFARAFYFFDADTVDGARTAWRALRDRADTERRYWKRDDAGRWVEGP